MPTGYHAVEYYRNPDIDKPIEQIWADQNDFSDEHFSFEELKKYNFTPLDLFMPLPPLLINGKFIKGIILSQCIDVFTEKFPRLKNFFHLCAYSMWSSYPKSETADVYFTCYDNPERDHWFKKTFPEKAGKILIPGLDSDFHDEYRIAPRNVTKDIDVLTVGRMDSAKNHPIIARALKIYRQKYEDRIYLTHVVGKKGIDADYNGFNENEMKQVRQVQEILDSPKEYIKLISQVGYDEMGDYYSRAKVLVLASLHEGKNRSLIEAVSCDTPVICFKAHNQYVKGNDQVFPDGAGMYCDFDPESLAAAIHEVIHNPEKFTPRYSYLKNEGGRAGFFNKIIDAIPYYQKHLPEFEAGNHRNNIGLVVAVQKMYGVSLNDFLYKGHSWVQGWDDIAARLGNSINQCERIVTGKGHPDGRQSRFDIAQSYFDDEEYDLAYDNYELHSADEHADKQEVFWSLYRMGRCLELNGESEERILVAYLNAYEHTPERIEPLYRLAMYFAETAKAFGKAYAFASVCVNAEKPEKALFLNEPVYDWARYDDMGFICINLDRFEQAQTYIKKAMALNAYPPSRQEGLETNLAICKNHLSDPIDEDALEKPKSEYEDWCATVQKNRSENKKVNKTIYMCYKHKDIPPKVIRNWEDMNPGWKVALYDDHECSQFLHKYYPHVAGVYDSIKHGPIRADLWRICVLHKYGGVYADIDLKPLVPLDAMGIHNPQVALAAVIGIYNEFWQEKNDVVQSFIYSPYPGNPIFSISADVTLETWTQSPVRDEYWTLSGVLMLSKAMTKSIKSKTLHTGFNPLDGILMFKEKAPADVTDHLQSPEKLYIYDQDGNKVMKSKYEDWIGTGDNPNSGFSNLASGQEDIK